MQHFKQFSSSLLCHSRAWPWGLWTSCSNSGVQFFFTETPSKLHSTICTTYLLFWYVLLDFSLSILIWVEEDHKVFLSLHVSWDTGSSSRSSEKTVLRSRTAEWFCRTSWFCGSFRKQHFHCKDKKTDKKGRALFISFKAAPEKEDRSEQSHSVSSLAHQ